MIEGYEPSWWLVVTDMEDVSPGTIRVYAQIQATDADREDIARGVFNFNGIDVTDLQVVVVRDASGVDSNHYRRDFPHLVQ